MNEVNIDEVVLLKPSNIDVAEGSKRIPSEAGGHPLSLVASGVTMLVWLFMVVLLYPEQRFDVTEMDTILFLLFVLNLILGISGVVRDVRSYQRRLRLQNTGQVRQGRIMSMKPSPIPFFTQIRYEVSADDGTLATGKQAVTRGTAKRLAIGAPIAVLYADPKTQFVL